MGNFSKINGTWKLISKYFKKENGQWEEITESYFEEYEILHPMTYGGNIKPAGPTHSSDAYNPSGTQTPNSDIIYDNEPGMPNVKTNASGDVVEYTFTDTGGTGVTVSDVDTGIIAFDSNNPGWTLHLVAEMTPNENNNKNIIQAYNSTDRRGLYVYGVNSYCYKKIQTADYSTNSSFVAWSKFSPTGKDTSYYSTKNTITFDATYTTDKKLSLYINNVEHFSNFSVDDTTFQNLTVQVGVGMTNFTIKEFSVTRTNA